MAVAVALFATACSRDSEVVGSADGEDVTRGDVFDAVDDDGDGVVARDEFETAVLLADPDTVVASWPAGEITIGQVLLSLEEEPPSTLSPGETPDQNLVVSRLTSILRLRLSGLALTDLGFPVDLERSDADINAEVAELVNGPFEAFAREQVIGERPEIVKLATPHCLTLLAVTTEAEAVAAAERVRGGETAFDVALEVNFEGTTEPGGSLGCNNIVEWQQVIGDLAADLEPLGAGEMSTPANISSQGSPTGEFWVVMHVDDIVEDEADPALLGPFAGGPLTTQMQTYEIVISAQLGTWSAESLSILLPAS
jgi:hypothetical protein